MVEICRKLKLQSLKSPSINKKKKTEVEPELLCIPMFPLDRTWVWLESFSELARKSPYRSALSNNNWLPGDA